MNNSITKLNPMNPRPPGNTSMRTILLSLLFVLGMTGLGTGLLAATITVANTNDSGAGSLRQAITDAAAGDTITFAAGVTGTITLTSGELLISQSALTIQGPGANVLAVSGNDASRVFDIGGNVTVAGATISGLTIRNGHTLASDSHQGIGGGILNFGTLNLSFCVVSNNSGSLLGGGIAHYLASGNSIISHCTISGNTVNGIGGGIVGYQSRSPLSITDTTIAGNAATTGGGGIYDDLTTITIARCTINGNTTTGSGGGIAMQEAPLTITDTTISGNSASSGGGILVNLGTVNIAATTITSNMGGGLSIPFSQCTVSLTSTIIALNPTDVSGDVTGSFNLIGNGTGETGITNGTNSNQVGTAAAPIDPKLGPLADNGGPTQTQALLPGSPAIDQGGAVAGVTTDQRGFPRPVDDPAIPNAPGGDGSDIGAFEVAGAAPPATQLLNISTRMEVVNGQDNLGIGGFILTGSCSRRVIIRGIGPSLSNFNLSNVLADPTLELHTTTNNADVILAKNDNWKIDDATQQSQEAAVRATGLPPTSDAESAIIATLAPGNYTALLRGKNGGLGIGLVEVYALDSNNTGCGLANVSTRGFVDTGDNVMIGGFILGPQNATSVNILIRAIGPSMAQQVNGTLADPTLSLHDGNGTLIAFNDDWQQDAQANQIPVPLQPTDSRESALFRTLAPGAYTAIVRGKVQTTGIALVEGYYVQ
ncbi:MAG: choice-of-anchor Q domain-containing protein [Chthoniobacterales bacterium]